MFSCRVVVLVLAYILIVLVGVNMYSSSWALIATYKWIWTCRQCRNSFIHKLNVTNLTKIITSQTDRKKPRISSFQTDERNQGYAFVSDRQKETKDMPSFQADRKKLRICLRFRQTKETKDMPLFQTDIKKPRICVRFRQTERNQGYAFVSDRQKETWAQFHSAAYRKQIFVLTIAEKFA